MKQTDAPIAERNNIQVISRAASILRILEKNPNGMSLGEISKAVDLPRSTVQRIVDALDRESLVIASTAANGVRLGPVLIPLAAATRFQITDIARPTIESLARATGETVMLGIANQDKVVLIDQITSDHALTFQAPIGRPFPFHSSAAGKAVLAILSEAEIAKLKKRLKLSKQTKSTLTSWDSLEREVRKVAETGVAYNLEENSPGICAIASALRSPTGDIAAIAIAVPTQRFNEKRAALVKSLRAHISELRSKLGSR